MVSKVNTCNCSKSKKEMGYKRSIRKDMLYFIPVEVNKECLCIHCGSYTFYQDLDNSERREYANTRAKEDRYNDSSWMNGESKWL